MAGNLNEKLQQILKKLEKLDTIEKSTSKIESSLKELEIRMAKMEEFKITASKDIQELKDGLSYVGDQVQEAKLDEVSKNLTQIDELKKESSSKLEELTTQNLYLEAYSRRENIKFFNIEETPRENVEEVLRDFLEEELGHQDAREIEIQRVHRVGKTKGDKPRPILARFLRYNHDQGVRRDMTDRSTSTSDHEVHVSDNSCVADHCSVFATSDSTDPDFGQVFVKWREIALLMRNQEFENSEEEEIDLYDIKIRPARSALNHCDKILADMLQATIEFQILYYIALHPSLHRPTSPFTNDY
ncbi:hypothetical protein QZH41_001407 [Actinostola sp. cb2023]|nr:hypothetical protein QZH41_001407 [Actinostola sp. cb2023]